MSGESRGGGLSTPSGPSSQALPPTLQASSEILPHFEAIRCPLCGSDETVTYLQGPDRMYPVPGTFRLARCLACDLVYQNPRLRPQTLARHYPDEYLAYTWPGRSESLMARLGWQYGFERYRRCRFVTRFKHGGRLLDVGCATGTFLADIRDFGNWQPLGVEMNPRAAAIARRRHGLDVVIARFEEMELPARTFDAVTLWDVLEHLPDPGARLRSIRRGLKLDGLLFLSVPVLDSLDARLFRRYWIGFDLPRHLQVFSRQSLTQMLDQAGFRIVATAHPTGSHYSFTQSLRLFLDAHVSNQRFHKALTRWSYSLAFRALLMPYFLMTEGLGLGASLTVAAQPV